MYNGYKFKRMFCIMLSVLLVLAMVPLSAFALEPIDESNQSNTENGALSDGEASVSDSGSSEQGITDTSTSLSQEEQVTTSAGDSTEEYVTADSDDPESQGLSAREDSGSPIVPLDVTQGYIIQDGTGSELTKVNSLKEAFDFINANVTTSDFRIIVTSNDSWDVSAQKAQFGLTGTEAKSVTLTSDGETCTLSAASGSDYLITITGNNSLAIENITLDGNGVAGGIALNTSLTLPGGTLSLNSGALITNCYQSGNGAGVRVIGESQTVLNIDSGATITKCTSNAEGGGVYVSSSSLNMTGGMISSCTANAGGGLSLSSGSVVAMSGGAISTNSSTSYGGGVKSIASSFVMSNQASIDNNQTQNGGAHGAGVHTESGSGNASFELNDNASIRDNQTLGDGTMGGGIFVSGANNKLTLNSGSISSNTSTLGGGGVYLFNSAVFEMYGGAISKNTAGQSGGAISAYYNATLTVDGGVIGGTLSEGNKALIGGGIYSSSADVTIQGTANVSGNTASVSAANAGGLGGGIYSVNSSVLLVSGSAQIHDNVAAQGGGGIYSNADCRLTDQAEVYGNSSHATDGGGIFVRSATLTVDAQVLVYDNYAYARNGGGIAAQESTLNISGSLVNNRAIAGGGLYSFDAISLDLNNAAFEGNSGTNGGGMYIDGDNQGAFSANATFTDNSASENGGGVYLYLSYSSYPFTSSEFEGNSANNGGAIFIDGAASYSGMGLILESGTVLNDNSAYNGGGVYLKAINDWPQLLQTSGNVQFSNNSAVSEGGAIYTETANYSNPAYTSTAYSGLVCGDLTVFIGNTARLSYEPPVDAASFAFIEFAQTSIFDHPLNNYDINFTYTITYPIQYVLDGGTNDSSNPSFYTYGEGVSSFADPSKEGYQFKGWFVDSDYSVPISFIGATDSGEKTLYALWDIDTYTITYNSNTGMNSLSKIDEITQEETYLIRDLFSDFARDGYTFIGWNTATDGTGVSYAVGEELSSEDVMAELVLYAQWEQAVTTDPPSNQVNTKNTTALSKTSDTLTSALLSGAVLFVCASSALILSRRRLNRSVYLEREK